MSSLTPSEQLIRRLRAHGLLPATGLAALVTAGARLSDGTKVAWLAVHPVSGLAYPVASAFTVKQVAGSPSWSLRTEGGVTMVVPDDQRPARLAGSRRTGR